MARIFIYLNNEVIAEYALLDKPLVIGRDDNTDIVLKNPAVSQKHAHLFYEQGKFVVEDMISMNGVFIKGKKITRSILEDGDELYIGPYILRFNQEGGDAVWQRLSQNPAANQPISEHTLYMPINAKIQPTQEQNTSTSNIGLIIIMILFILGIVFALYILDIF